MYGSFSFLTSINWGLQILGKSLMNSVNAIATSIFDKISKVETFICYNKDNIESSHISNINNGYEGSILRNANGIYKPKFRSYDLLKYKNFDDDEFEIAGITSEIDTSGNNENLIVWICKKNVDI
jgi:ATP-dependent DNA ligase